MTERESLLNPMTSSIHLPMAVSWAEIQKRAKEFAVGKTFSKSHFDITIKDLVIWEDGQLVHLQVETSGTYDGIIRVTTRPAFDKKANKFEFQDLKLDMAADSFFQRGLILLLKGQIEKQLEKQLGQTLDEPIQEFTKKANEEIRKFKPMPNISLVGELENFKLIDFGYDAAGIILQLAAQGKLSVRMV